MAIIINLFGGPGTGKSTTAAGLFHTMKVNKKRVELVTEYAKDLTYQESFKKLKDNAYVTFKQHHRIFQSKDVVDYIITDSPIVQSLIYPVSHPYNQEGWNSFVLGVHNAYESINVFLERDEDKHPYQMYGRTQSKDQAIELDNKILEMLNNNGINFIKVAVGDNAHLSVYEKIFKEV